ATLGLRADEARALASRGRAELLSGDDGEALSALKRARELYQAEGNKVGEALVALTQAQLHHAHGNNELAYRLAVQAEADLTALGGWHHILLARWLRADIARALDYMDEARRLFESAVQDSIAKGQPQITERCHTGLGLVALSKGDTAAAERHFRNAVAVTEELRAPLPSEEFRTAFFANKLAPYNELVRICLDHGDERLVEALTIVESARSRTLADSLGGSHENLLEPRDGFEASLLTQIGELREELNYLYKEINQPVNGGNRRLPELQRELQEREKKVLEVTRQLHHRRESDASPLQSFDVQQLQQQLGENDALVEFTSLGDELLAFVVSRDRVDVVRSLESLPEIGTRLQALRFQIDSLRFGARSIRRHLSTLTEKINVHLRLLYDQLIRPLEYTLDRRQRLIIVPQGELHYLPFHALHDGEQYLIERCEVSFAPSAAIFQQCLQRGEHELSRALLLGVADEQAPRIIDEINKLKDVFPDATALVENDATSEALRRHSNGVDVLHLACHGQFRSDNPLFSALRLADGWFTVRDAYSLKLDNALVTLSACETGANVVAPGDELIGLARGFFSAGARSVLLSLWMVDDETTDQMMIDFYEETRRG
ncbi:MAG TPA: CHAT domain-containing protein, partial [Pyrinomonadaceae bacterium]|nr:CHAT domain-containing protein [Pyrinomonadaceae bacterium]